MHNTIEDQLDQFLGDLLHTGRDAVVLLEDRDDQSFWELILHEFLPGLKFDFPFMSSTGKDRLRPFKEHTSKKMLICVDSDNDAFHSTSNSSWINPRHPFIYQTYSHSRENHFFHPQNLNQECSEITLSPYDFTPDFQQISEALYEWLIIWLFFTDDNQKWIAKEITDLSAQISWSKLKVIIKSAMESLDFQNISNIREVLNICTELKTAVSEQKELILNLIIENGHDYLVVQLSEFKSSCPIPPEDSLWFIQGHCAFDNIMLPYFNKVVALLAAEQYTLASNTEDRNKWSKLSRPGNNHEEILKRSFRLCLLTQRPCSFFGQIKTDMQADFS